MEAIISMVCSLFIVLFLIAWAFDEKRDMIAFGVFLAMFILISLI